MEYEQKVRKKVWEIFGNSKKVTTFALAIEREIIDAKDGPFVYRLGRKIFILILLWLLGAQPIFWIGR